MDPTCRCVLQDRMQFLLENLHINPVLTASLIQSSTLNDNLVEEITAKVTTNEKIECLVKTLKRRGSKAFTNFTSALRKSDQEFIADDLSMCRKKEETRCDQKILEILSKYPALQRRLSTAQDIPELKRLFAVRDDLEQARKENINLQDTIDDMKSEMSKLQRHLELYIHQVEEKQQELDLLNNRLDEVTTDNEHLHNQILDTTRSMTKPGDIKPSYDTSLEELKVNYSQAPKLICQAFDEVDTQTITNLNQTIVELQKALQDKDNELQNIKQEHQTLLGDLNNKFGHLQLDAKKTSDDSTLTNSTSAFRNIFESIAQTILPRQDSPVPDNPLQDHLNKAQVKISSLERQVDSLKQAKQKLRTRLIKTKKSMSKTQSDMKRLESQVEAEQEHNKTLQSILANSRRRESIFSNSTLSSCSSEESTGRGTNNLTVPVLPIITRKPQETSVVVARIKVPKAKTAQPLSCQHIAFPPP